MTARRRRRHRYEPDDAMPDEVRAWFRGECPMPWAALLSPGFELVPTWWAEWCREHPGAVPPADALPGQFHGA